MTMSAHVPGPSSFVVVPVRASTNRGPRCTVDGTKKVVLDTLFSGAYQLDPRKRLIVHSSPYRSPEAPGMTLTRDDLRRIILVAHAQDAGFVDLVRMAELDPAAAFRGAILPWRRSAW